MAMFEAAQTLGTPSNQVAPVTIPESSGKIFHTLASSASDALDVIGSEGKC